MQQYIVVSRVPCLVRKIAPDGRHVVYYDTALDARIRLQWLTNGYIRESDLEWEFSGSNGRRHVSSSKESQCSST